MEYNFISPYKLCFTIGLINLIMNIFTLIISTYFDEKYDIPEGYKEYLDGNGDLSKINNEKLIGWYNTINEIMKNDKDHKLDKKYKQYFTKIRTELYRRGLQSRISE